jgi:hypothetical protein
MTTNRTFAYLSAAVIAAGLPLMAETDHIVVSGFETPESVVHDTLMDVYLVSNVGIGNPAALDHNGFVSRVSPDGSVQQLRWIQNGVDGVVLNGPKGIYLHRRELYVADIDTLRILTALRARRFVTWKFPIPLRPIRSFSMT